MLTHWLASPDRVVGPLVPVDPFVDAMPYDDTLIGVGSWRALSTSALLLSRRRVSALDTILADPCLSALLAASDVTRPLRVALPADSMVDLAQNCREADAIAAHEPVPDVPTPYDLDRCVVAETGLPVLAPVDWTDDVGRCSSVGRAEVDVANGISGAAWVRMRRHSSCIRTG